MIQLKYKQLNINTDIKTVKCTENNRKNLLQKVSGRTIDGKLLQEQGVAKRWRKPIKRSAKP